MTDSLADRTSVLAVGIEKYLQGSDMDLLGAADGAVRFARWARGRGVPPERIMLACSWLEEPATPPLLGAEEIDPTRDGLDHALQKLVQAGGALLLVYWCGHGLLNQDRERILFAANATTGNKLNIVVDEVLKLLSSTKGIGFDRQIMLIDACANHVEDMHFDGPLPRSTVAVGQPRAVRQFVLYAAGEGQFAAYDRNQRTSPFSTVVLDWFDGHADAGLPPDVTELERHVRTEFESRVAAGDHASVPAWLEVRPYGGQATWLPYGPLPIAGRVRTAAALLGITVAQVRRIVAAVLTCSLVSTDEARGRLVARFSGSSGSSGSAPVEPVGVEQFELLVSREFAENRFEDVLLALRESAGSTLRRLETLPVQECWERQRRIADAMQHFRRVTADQVRDAYYRAVPPDDRHEAGDLDEAMEWAALYLPKPDGTSPLTVFVAMLERLTGAVVPDAWFRLPPYLLETIRQQARELLERSGARVVLNLYAPGRPSSRLRWPNEVTGHVYREGVGWSPLDPVSCPPTLDGVQEAVHLMLERAGDLVRASYTVGIILQRVAFGTAPESWPQPQDLADPVPLGELHPVVLHSGERFASARPRQLWEERAQEIRRRLARERPDIAWLESDRRHDVAGLRQTVTASESSCVGLAFAPGDTIDRLTADPIIATVAAGAPYVLWVDREPGNWETVRRDIHDLLLRGAFDDLAGRVHRGRASRPEGLCAQLRLLWDEPKALPAMAMLGGIVTDGVVKGAT